MSDLGISHDGAPGDGQGAEGDSGRQSEFDYRQGYEQLRPEFTRTTQDLAETRQRLSEHEAFIEALADPGLRSEALASLGISVETGAPAADEFTDPLEQEVSYLRGVVDQLQQGSELEATSRREAEILDARDEFIDVALDTVAENMNIKLSPHDEEVLGNLAIAMSDEDGVPGVQEAFDALFGGEGFLERQRQQWIDSKSGAYSAPMGTSIPMDKRPTNRVERIDFFDQRLQALDQQQ